MSLFTISNLTTNWCTTSTVIQTPKQSTITSSISLSSSSSHRNNIIFPFCPYPFVHIYNRSHIVNAKKKKTAESEPILKPSIVEEVIMDDDDDDDDDDELIFDEFEDGQLVEDDSYFEDDYFAEDTEPCVGDGSGGGGISLAGTWWDKKALAIAEEVASSFDGELGIYAFKTLLNASIQLRVERLTNKSGSPSITDIEAFTIEYRTRLDEAEVSGSVPENLFLEVSSPGVERVVRIPQDLDRFKDRPLYVKYVTEVAETGSLSESDGVFRLVSFDLETESCTWGVADVRVNREKAGKGRPLSKKQREWRLDTPFDTLRLVRLYSEC